MWKDRLSAKFSILQKCLIFKTVVRRAERRDGVTFCSAPEPNFSSKKFFRDVNLKKEKKKSWKNVSRDLLIFLAWQGESPSSRGGWWGCLSAKRSRATTTRGVQGDEWQWLAGSSSSSRLDLLEPTKCLDSSNKHFPGKKLTSLKNCSRL